MNVYLIDRLRKLQGFHTLIIPTKFLVAKLVGDCYVGVCLPLLCPGDAAAGPEDDPHFQGVVCTGAAVLWAQFYTTC